MTTIVDYLRTLSAYPIPVSTLVTIAEGRGLRPYDYWREETNTQYQKAVADVLMWLSNAPDVSQGGQSYSLSDDQRKQLRARAMAIYHETGDAVRKQTIYGYKGSRL